MKSPSGLKLARLLAQARSAATASRREAQFDALYAAIALAPDAPSARLAMSIFLGTHCPGFRHADIDAMWRLALEQAWMRPADLAPAAMHYIAVDPVMAHALALRTVATANLHAVAYYLERHPVFHVLARVAVLADVAWQTLLARLREFLLTQRRSGDMQAPLHLSLALAMQNDLTEGIEPPEAATLAYAQELEARCLERIEAGLPVDAADIALAMTALLPERSALAPCLASAFGHKHWPALAPLLALPAAHHREATLRERLQPEAMQTANDPVQAQYESHPYPRWVREPLGQTVELALPVRARVKAITKRGMRVLVAGCGTGQQLFVARSKYPRAQLVAVDFSVASLAHAMRKCEEAGLVNVEFHAMDLHRIASLAQRYDAIECVGVLQHLPDPAAGLALLADVLKPDGLLYLGVSSPYARAATDRLRERIAALGLDSNSASIRAFRRRLIQEQPCTVAPELAHAADFHVVSGLRDLLFHAREQALPLPAWVAMAQRLGLELIDLEVTPAVAGMARKRFEREPDRLTPLQWESLEQDEPHAFSSLYRMWLAR